MAIFWCRLGHGEEDDWHETKAFDVTDAAEVYAELRFGQDDYPDIQRIEVRCGPNDTDPIFCYDVATELETCFRILREIS